MSCMGCKILKGKRKLLWLFSIVSLDCVKRAPGGDGIWNFDRYARAGMPLNNRCRQTSLAHWSLVN